MKERGKSNILSLKWALGKKLTKQKMNLVSVLFQVQEIKLTEAHLISKKTLRQCSSYTTKKKEDEPEAPQPLTVARGNPTYKTTSSSRTDKCLMSNLAFLLSK